METNKRDHVLWWLMYVLMGLAGVLFFWLALLKLIYRDAIPTKGKVFVFNHDISRLRLREIPFHRRRIGVIFQDFLLLL